MLWKNITKTADIDDGKIAIYSEFDWYSVESNQEGEGQDFTSSIHVRVTRRHQYNDTVCTHHVLAF